MVNGFTGAFDESFYYCRGGWNVWITNSEVNQIDPAGQSFAFPPIDFGEKIWR